MCLVFYLSLSLTDFTSALLCFFLYNLTQSFEHFQSLYSKEPILILKISEGNPMFLRKKNSMCYINKSLFVPCLDDC